MTNTIQLKRKTTAGQSPPSTLAVGELVINTGDGLIFYGDSSGDRASLSDTYSVKAGNTSLTTTGTVSNGTWNSSFGSSAYASTSAKGVASFNSDNFAVSSGVVTIKDGGVVTAEIADNAVTLAKMASGTDGTIITFDASGNPVAVGPGSDGQVLTSTGAGSPPAFEDATGGSANNSTITLTAGDGLQTGGSFTTNASGNSEITFNIDVSDFAGAGLADGGSENLAIDISEYSAVTPTSGDSFLTLDSNGSTEQLTTVDALATLLAGTNISASSGVLSVGTLNQNTTGSAATLTTARAIGGVNFDGSAAINLPGVNTGGNQDTSGTAAIATTVTVADESSDTSCFPLFSTAASGNLAPKSGSNLTFNSNTGTLAATDFSGKLTIGGHTVDDIDITSEFVDSDEHLMSAKAINARIQDFFVDENNMASDSASLVPTQQSVKAYVDTEVAGAGGGTGNISFSDTTMAGNAMTLDSAGEIALDADDNGEVKFFDGGAHYATMQKNSTQGLKLTAGSESKVILTTEDTGILATTGHQWIQAHHFGISNLDNNTPVFLSWASSNSNQSDIANHRPLMPCAGRILKCLITCQNSNSNALATMTNGSNDFEMELSGSSTFSDVGHGAGIQKIGDPGRIFENTSNYPVDLSPLQTAVDNGSAGIDATLLGYTWAAGDTIVGKIKNHSGNSNQRASMTMLVEWTV